MITNEKKKQIAKYPKKSTQFLFCLQEIEIKSMVYVVCEVPNHKTIRSKFCDCDLIDRNRLKSLILIVVSL